MTEGISGEIARLPELEACVERGMRRTKEGVIEAGEALREIKETKAFTESGHANWMIYVRERWGWGISAAYEIIRASEVLKEFSARAERVEFPTTRHAYLVSEFKTPEERLEVAKAIMHRSARDAEKYVRGRKKGAKKVVTVEQPSAPPQAASGYEPQGRLDEGLRDVARDRARDSKRGAAEIKTVVRRFSETAEALFVGASRLEQLTDGTAAELDEDQRRTLTSSLERVQQAQNTLARLLAGRAAKGE